MKEVKVMIILLDNLGFLKSCSVFLSFFFKKKRWVVLVIGVEGWNGFFVYMFFL